MKGGGWLIIYELKIHEMIVFLGFPNNFLWAPFLAIENSTIPWVLELALSNICHAPQKNCSPCVPCGSKHYQRDQKSLLPTKMQRSRSKNVNIPNEDGFLGCEKIGPKCAFGSEPKKAELPTGSWGYIVTSQIVSHMLFPEKLAWNLKNHLWVQEIYLPNLHFFRVPSHC